MAHVEAFKCDVCGVMLPIDSRTRKVTRYDGDAFSGERHEDLCPGCVEQQTLDRDNFKPLRRRKRGDQVGEGVAAG